MPRELLPTPKPDDPPVWKIFDRILKPAGRGLLALLGLLFVLAVLIGWRNKSDGRCHQMIVEKPNAPSWHVDWHWGPPGWDCVFTYDDGTVVRDRPIR